MIQILFAKKKVNKIKPDFILSDYGLFGLVLYTRFKKNYYIIGLNRDNFLKKINDFYMDILTKVILLIQNTYDDRIICLDEFIKVLPSLSEISQIILNKQYNKKDTVPIKLVLDIFEQYYRLIYTHDEVELFYLVFE